MPARWQRWMPLEIDALKGSPAVQAMHPSARSGYLWLLLAAWQTDDCAIPIDPIDLADQSGLGDELWAIHGARILRKFERIDGSDRLRNLPQYERWQAAKAVYDKRYENAERTNERRISSSKETESVTISDTISSRSASVSSAPLEPPLTETGTGTETKEQKQKPSRGKREGAKKSDVTTSRHAACKEEIFAYYRTKNNGEDPDWDGREGKALGMLLGANPKLTENGVRKLLEHRAQSEVNHSERPGIWLPLLKSYLNGPLNRFKQSLKGENGNGRSNGFTTKSERTANNVAELLGIQLRPGGDHTGPGEGNHDAGGGGIEGIPSHDDGRIIEGKL